MDVAKRIWEAFKRSLEPASKIAQIAAVVIAGYWTYHIHQITGEIQLNPELSVSAQTFPYSKDARLLMVRIRAKNVGKVRIYLVGDDALSVTLTKIPDALVIGYVDIDKQSPVLQKNDLFKRYGGGSWVSPGAESEYVVEFIVAPSLYHIQASLVLPDGTFVDNAAVERVE